MSNNVGSHGPLGVMPVQSGHGDVHEISIGRTNGDSVTVSEYKRIFFLVTGRELKDSEIPWDWFAEEDRI